MRVEVLLGIFVATGVLSIRFVLTDRPVFSIIAVVVALLWMAGVVRRWRHAADAGFTLFTLLIVVALLAGPNGVGWSLPPLLGAIVAWNAGHLDRLLIESKHVPRRSPLLRRYRVRLYGALAAGTLLLITALLVQINLTFAATVLLALLGMLALSRAIHLLSRSGS